MDSDYYLSGLFNDVTIQALTAGPVVALSLAILLLYVSAFVSASEIAFFSLEQEDLNTIRKGDHPADNTIQHFLKNPEYLLATILIFNNLANVTVIVLCTYGFNGLSDFRISRWQVLLQKLQR